MTVPYAEPPLPGMPEPPPPKKVEPVKFDQFKIEGEVDPPSYRFKANLLDLILMHLAEFREFIPDMPYDEDGGYFDEKVNGFLCEVMDEALEIWAHDRPYGANDAALKWDVQFDYPDYNWRFGDDQIEGIREYLVERELWSADEERTRYAEKSARPPTNVR